jgi:hypothetical protein
MLAAYIELAAAARRYYARRDGDNRVATFSAALLLAGLFFVNSVSVLTLLDLLLYDRMRLLDYAIDHASYYVFSMLVVGALHVFVAFKAERLGHLDSHKGHPWSRRLLIYVVVTIVGVAATVMIMIVRHPAAT